MAVVNGFMLYNTMHEDKKISIKEYRRQIAYPYFKSGHGMRITRGRQLSLSNTSRTNIPVNIRYDNNNHIVVKREKQRRF